MRFLIFAGFLAALAGVTNAEILAQDVERLGSLEVQRAKISAQRAKLQADFLQEDVACYEKFAVNSCLDKVNVKRNHAMAELRKQEILLNDEERKNKGEAQIQKIQEKSSPENLQEAAQQRAKVTEDYQLRLEREKNRQQERNTAVSGEKAARDAHAKKLTDHQKKSQARIQKQTAAAEEAQKFNDRKKEAEAHKAQHEADQLKRTNPPANPLPLPELPR